MLRLFRITFIILLLISCSSKEYKHNTYGYFDVKDNKIVYAYYKENIGSIYLNNFDNDSIIRLTSPINATDDYPIFSEDAKKILYSSFPKEDEKKSSLIVYDIQFKISDTLFKEDTIMITDYCFSKNGAYVYYLKASVFKNYSPIASKRPHGVDLFEINLNSKKIKQITNLEAYSITDLKVVSDSLIAGTIRSGKIPDGMGLFNIKTGVFNKIELKNDPRYEVNEWYVFSHLREDTLVYSVFSDVYKHSLLDNSSKLLYRHNNNLGDERIDKNWENVYFRLYNEYDGIYKYNFKDKKRSELFLKPD